MANAWGNSWGNSWGASWGSIAAEDVAVQRGGTSKSIRPYTKRHKTLAEIVADEKKAREALRPVPVPTIAEAVAKAAAGLDTYDPAAIFQEIRQFEIAAAEHLAAQQLAAQIAEQEALRLQQIADAEQRLRDDLLTVLLLAA